MLLVKFCLLDNQVIGSNLKTALLYQKTSATNSTPN